MKGRLEVLRSNFQDFGHFGPFLTFLTDDLSPFLIKFGSFWPFWVDFGSIGGPEGSGKMADRSGRGQLGLAESGEWSGGRGRGGLGVRFWPFWVDLGSKFGREGSKFGREGRFLVPGVKI